MLTIVDVTATGGAGNTMLALVLAVYWSGIGCRADRGAYAFDGLSVVDVAPIGEEATEIAKLARTFDEVANG